MAVSVSAEHDAWVRQWAEALLIRDSAGVLDLVACGERVPKSDLLGAREIMRAMQGRITYGSRTGKWRMWNGVVHADDAGGGLGRLVGSWADVIAYCMREVKTVYAVRAASATGAAVGAVWREFKTVWGGHTLYRDRCFTDGGQNALISQMRKLACVDDELFDVDTRWLVARNGVIDLERVMLDGEVDVVPHDPARLVTKVLGCDWDPDAVSHVWETYIRRSLPDRQVREYLQTVAGMALLGDPQEKVFVNLIGIGNSGKSVWLDVMMNVFGGYAQMVPVKTFLARSGDSDFERDLMKGARFVASSEPGKGKKIDDDVVKSITGRDLQTTAAKNQNSTTWKPQCTIFIASNHAVKIDTTDKALMARVKPVRFPVQFVDGGDEVPVERRMDKRLERKLGVGWDQSGVLNWLLDGCLMYRHRGLVEPDAVREARGHMEVEVEPVLQWVEESIENGSLSVVEVGADSARSSFATVGSLYAAYFMWAGASGERPVTKRSMSTILQSRFGPVINSGGRRIPGLIWTPERESERIFAELRG